MTGSHRGPTVSHLPQGKVSLCQALGTPDQDTPPSSTDCLHDPGKMSLKDWGIRFGERSKLGQGSFGRLAGESRVAGELKERQNSERWKAEGRKRSQLTGRVVQPARGGLCTCQRNKAGHEGLCKGLCRLLHTQLSGKTPRDLAQPGRGPPSPGS